MSTQVPPFSQRFGEHPILTLQEAPVNPNAHVPVVEVVETDVVVGGLVDVLVALLKVLLSVVLLETVVLVTLI